MAEYIKRDDALRELEQINPVDYGAMWDYEAHHYVGECLRDCKDALEGIPAADVALVVYGKPNTKIRTVMLIGYHEEIGVFAKDGSNLYRKKMAHADIPYDYCPACGAILCSRWHNFCGKCGAKMDVEDGDDSDAADGNV